MTYDMIKAGIVQAAPNDIYTDVEVKKISDMIEQYEANGITADEAVNMSMVLIDKSDRLLLI